MNRISTANAYETSVENLQRRQQDLYQAQDRMTSGKRVARASDDPTAAARVERALATSARALADQRGVEASRNAMQQDNLSAVNPWQTAPASSRMPSAQA